MKKLILFFVFQFVLIQIYAQEYPSATKAADRNQGFETRKQLNEQALVKELNFRSIGPAIMSGRVSDIDVNPQNPNEFYVADTPESYLSSLFDLLLLLFLQGLTNIV